MNSKEVRLQHIRAEAELLAAHLENLTHQSALMEEAMLSTSRALREMGGAIRRMSQELGELRVETMKGTDSGTDELHER